MSQNGKHAPISSQDTSEHRASSLLATTMLPRARLLINLRSCARTSSQRHRIGSNRRTNCVSASFPASAWMRTRRETTFDTSSKAQSATISARHPQQGFVAPRERICEEQRDNDTSVEVGLHTGSSSRSAARLWLGVSTPGRTGTRRDASHSISVTGRGAGLTARISTTGDPWRAMTTPASGHPCRGGFTASALN